MLSDIDTEKWRVYLTVGDCKVNWYAQEKPTTGSGY